MSFHKVTEAGNTTAERNSPVPPRAPVWNPQLYQLQQQAPRPTPVCTQPVENCPPYYGPEFHGVMSHLEAAAIVKDEGAYLVRQSVGTKDFFTLTFRFSGKLKHYKLYYDGQHYVRDKRFDMLCELVADALISLYFDKYAAPFLEAMDSFNSYERSPYMALNKLKLRKVIGYSSKKYKINKTCSNLLHKEKKISENAQLINKEIDTKAACNETMTEDTVAVAESSVTNVENNGTNTECDGATPEQVVVYDKPHVFKMNTFIGLNWCEYCGYFLWGFISQGVKCDDCGFSAHNKCSRKVPADCCPDLKHIRGVFGIDLTTLVKVYRTIRPFVVDKCINEIEWRGLQALGLYRVSGFSDEIEALKLALDKDGELTDTGPGMYDIHVIASTLKLYLRLLPIPLVTYEVHPMLTKAAKQSSLQEQMAGIKEALSLLPPVHFNTLKYLMEHLHRVMLEQSVNQMTAHNLSTVFAPTLMPSVDLSKGLPEITFEIRALELMITHQNVLFN